MSNNIIFNKKLEEYNKKYRNGRYRLLKYTKKEVEQYDKIANQTYKTKNYLLKGRKWALIGDTYYEIPKAPRALWFRNINAGVKAATCALVGGAVAGGAGYGIYVAVANGKQPVKPDPGPEPEPIVEREVEINKKVQDYVDVKNAEVTAEGFSCEVEIKSASKETLELSGRLVVKIGKVKLESTDYSFDKETGKVKISRSVLNKYKGKIDIAPEVQEQRTVIETETAIADVAKATEDFGSDAKQYIEYGLSDVKMTNNEGDSVSLVSLDYQNGQSGGSTSAVATIKKDKELKTLPLAGDYYNEEGITSIIEELEKIYEVVCYETNTSGNTVIDAYNKTGNKELRVKYEINTKGYLVHYINKDENYEVRIEYKEDAAKQLPESTTVAAKGMEVQVGETGSASIKANENLKSETTTDPNLVITEKIKNDDGTTSKVESIEQNGFRNNSDPDKSIYSFENIDISATVGEVGAGAFQDNFQVNSVTIEDNSQLKIIGEEAFSNLSMTEFNFPASVEKIGKAAFKSCKQLTKIYINNEYVANLKEDGADKTYLFENVTTVYVKEGVEVDDDSYLNKHYKKTDRSTEDGYILYETIEVPKYLKFKFIDSVLGGNACTVFFNDEFEHSLHSNIINVPTEVDGEYVEDGGQRGVTYQVTTVATQGFSIEYHDYESLKAVTTINLPEGIKTIGNEAFGAKSESSNGVLEEVNIPSTVTLIENNAFTNCTNKNLKVKFANKTGWVVTDIKGEQEPITLQESSLTDPKAAAAYLTDTYTDYTWTNGEEPVPPKSVDLVFDEIEQTKTYRVRAKTPASIKTDVLTIPPTYMDGNVVAIEENGFIGAEIGNVILPATLTTIEPLAFAGAKVGSVHFDESCQTGWKQKGGKEEVDVSANPDNNAKFLTDAEGKTSWCVTGLERNATSEIVNMNYDSEDDEFL